MDWLNQIGAEVPQYDEHIESLNIEDSDWEKERLGKVTGSTFGKLVVKSKDKKSYVLSQGQTAEKLIYRIAWERLLLSGNISDGLGRLSVSSREMQHGNDFESAAIMEYEKLKDIEVVRGKSFVKMNDWIGGTPDGFIGEDGLIEVKCPFNGGNHLKSLLTGEIYNKEYIFQIQGYLWITGRKWCDFVTYDPDLIENLQLNVIRVKRDESIIEAIKKIMDQVVEKIKEIINHEKLK